MITNVGARTPQLTLDKFKFHKVKKLQIYFTLCMQRKRSLRNGLSSHFHQCSTYRNANAHRRRGMEEAAKWNSVKSVLHALCRKSCRGGVCFPENFHYIFAGRLTHTLKTARESQPINYTSGKLLFHNTYKNKAHKFKIHVICGLIKFLISQKIPPPLICTKQSFYRYFPIFTASIKYNKYTYASGWWWSFSICGSKATINYTREIFVGGKVSTSKKNYRLP